MGRRPDARRRADGRLRLVHGGAGKPGTQARGDATQPLVHDLRKQLRSAEPMDFLGLISSRIAALERPRRDQPPSELSGFVESLIGTDLAETTAALTALAALVPDADLFEDIRAELAHRSQRLPLWLRDIHGTEVTDAAIVGDPGGAGDHIVLGYTWADGTASSLVVHVDHDAGTVVREAFTPGGAFAEVMDRFNELLDDEPAGLTETLALDDARALLEEALHNGDELGDDVESDSWPMARPALEWLVSLMPEPEDVELDDAPFESWTDLVQSMVTERRPLLQDFGTSDAASSRGLRLTGPGQDRAALGLVVAATATLTDEEFLSWTPGRVRQLFDVLPTMFLVGSAVARRLPVVLEALAVWSLARLGASAQEVASVQEGARFCGAEYVAIATSPQAALLRDATRGYEALVDQQVPGLPIIELADEDDFDEWLLDHIAAKVGGRDALMALDTEPLPDEAFDWSVVPDDVHAAVEQVLEPLDEFTSRVGGVEYRTACRRFLAAVVAGDANVFRRRASAAGSAGAIAWLLGRENGFVSASGASMRAQDLWAQFGVSGSSSRPDTFRQAIGVRWGGLVGRPQWLVSARRQALIRQRHDALARGAARRG